MPQPTSKNFYQELNAITIQKKKGGRIGIGKLRGGNQVQHYQLFGWKTKSITWTADFSNESRKLGSKVQGVLQHNSDFIFYVVDHVYRKMVLGATLKVGYLPRATNIWTNTDTRKKIEITV